MNKTQTHPLMIFTDLDGTLLDHTTYQWHAAKPALELAAANEIPVIPCTSKTLAECLHWQREMSLSGPVVFENGAGLALPQKQFKRPTLPPADDLQGFWVCRLARPYADIREVLRGLRVSKHYQFRGFGDMSAEQVRECTGLDLHSAELARQRRHAESLLWLDNAKSFDAFAKDIQTKGLILTRGSRFIHVSSPSDKGQAMLGLAGLYKQRLGKRPRLIALGDSGNDVPMLRAADIAVIIRPAHSAPLTLSPRDPQQRVLTSDRPGPQGWNDMISQILLE